MDPQQGLADQPRAGRLRLLFSLICGAVATAYAVGIVLGAIPLEHRLDATALTVLALATAVVVLLASPGLVSRFKRLELQGFKLEMLERVKDKQAQQEERLDDIALMLPCFSRERAGTPLESCGGSHATKGEPRGPRRVAAHALYWPVAETPVS